MRAFPWRGLFVIVLMAATHVGFGIWILALIVFWVANSWTLEFE